MYKSVLHLVCSVYYLLACHCPSKHSSSGQQVRGPRGAVEGSQSIPHVSWRQEPGPRSRGVRHLPRFPILPWVWAPNKGRASRTTAIGTACGRNGVGDTRAAHCLCVLTALFCWGHWPDGTRWDWLELASTQRFGGARPGAVSGPCWASILLPVLIVAHPLAGGPLPSEMGALLGARH